MKILLITFEFPPGLGGTGTYAYQMAKLFSEMGHDVTALVHTNNRPGDQIAEFDAQSAFRTIRYKAFRNKLLKILHRTWRSWRVLRKEGYDLLFIPYPNAAILGWLFKSLYGTPYVLAGHGSEFVSAGVWPMKQALRLAYRKADAALPNSDYTRDLMDQAHIDSPNIEVTPLGADDAIYDYRTYPMIGIKQAKGCGERKVVLTISSLRRLKGHRYVIEAIDRIRNEIPEVLYLIVGTGPEEEALRRLITAKGLEAHVRLEGFADWKKLREYYALCDVFVLNSTFESFGIVLIEAALMGKAVVASDVGGIPSVLEDGKSGILVRKEDPTATAEALKYLLTHPNAAAEMGEYGYQKAKRQLTWKHVSHRIGTIFEEIIEAKNE